MNRYKIMCVYNAIIYQMNTQHIQVLYTPIIIQVSIYSKQCKYNYIDNYTNM